MIKKHLILFTLLFISASQVYGQTDTLSLYRQAYQYLNDSIVKKKFAAPKKFESDCNSLIKGKKVRISPDLQVAHQFIKHGWGFPICEFVQEKYNYNGHCGTFSIHEYELKNHVLDSLKNYYKDYTFNEEIVRKTLRGFTGKKENGHQVFFSDYYKNALTAEMMTFCQSYKTEGWWGASTSFYFIFDDNNKLIEVYSGQVIHYN